jgi:hypothetical protein
LERKIITDKETSYHEAGHAVLGYHHDVTFKKISIIRGEHFAGSIEELRIDKLNVYQFLVTLAAGHAAELIYKDGREHELMSRFRISRKLECPCRETAVDCDYCAMINITREKLPDLTNKDRHLMCKVAIIEAKKFLESGNFWEAVEGLSKELLENRELLYEPAIKIIRKYNKDKIPCDLDKAFKSIDKALNVYKGF